MKIATNAHDDHSLLTIAEIANRFSLPESTARYYCKRFIDYLPHMGEGKRRRYRASALDVFTIVLEEMKKNKNAMAVEAVLSGMFPKNISVIANQSQAQQQNSSSAGSLAVPTCANVETGRFLELMERQSEAMSNIAAALGSLTAREGTITALERALEQKDQELLLLRDEISKVKVLQSESEKLHQQDLDQMRKWLGRIAGEQGSKK